MTLRLHRAAHQAETEPRRAVLEHEGRDDRLERPLARRVVVRVAGAQGEHLAPVLKREAETRHHDAGAHTAVITLDERHHVAARVGRREINRVAFLQRGIPGIIAAGGPRADQLSPLGRVGF